MKRRMFVAGALGIVFFVASRLWPFDVAPAHARGAFVESADERVERPVDPEDPAATATREPAAAPPARRISPPARPPLTNDRDDPPPWPTPVGALPSAWR